MVLRKLCYARTEAHLFLLALGDAAILGGVLGLGISAVWCSSYWNLSGVPGGAWWGHDSKQIFANMTNVLAADGTVNKNASACWQHWGSTNKLTCINTTRSGPPNGGTADSWCQQKHCLASFVLWSSKFICSMCTVFVGVMCRLTAESIVKQRLAAELAPDWRGSVEDEDEGGGGAEAGAEQLPELLRLAGRVLVLAGGLTWVAASIGGASMQLSSLVSSLSFVMVVLSVGIAGAGVGVDTVLESVKSDVIVQKFRDSVDNDWTKACALLFAGPGICCVFCISCCNQAFRRALGQRAFKVGNDLLLGLGWRQHPLTPPLQRHWRAMKGWHLTSVLRKLVLVGLCFFLFVVGVGKVVNVLLAILGKWLATKGVGFATMLYTRISALDSSSNLCC